MGTEAEIQVFVPLSNESSQRINIKEVEPIEHTTRSPQPENVSNSHCEN